MEEELEVKILNIDLDKMEEKVIKLGGKLIADEYQENIIIDSKSKPIKENLDGYLRIRKTDNRLNDKKINTLTLKIQEKTEEIRRSEEYNVNIDDINIMLTILEKLGYNSIETGYKHRKSYILEEARLDFDIWDKNTYPYPYMEIEIKNREHLNKLIDILDIDKNNISTKSIKELVEDLK